MSGGAGFFDIPSDLQHTYLGLIGEHLKEALIPVAGGLALSLPIAQLCVRFRWLYPPVLWVTTVLYAIPSIAFFVFLIDYTGATETTVMIPLTVYSLVVLVPAIVDGVRSVPQETLAAAEAMGFTSMQRYLRVELPIAVPAIFAGLRVATVSSISLVSVGSLIGNEGALGNLLSDAHVFHRSNLAVTSVVTTAVLAIVIDALLIGIRMLLTPWLPRGSRSARRASVDAVTGPAPEEARPLEEAAR
ncbi:ABC transporter permease [Actinacidiphila acididurans]|uniref:ABC transporter permease n=1 Tax=Actinacidiphila acididurans TaxID=2784346 RepID=A0ABS2U0R0_9ACTN|nr:ABC transporter permease [Actinacidiphila acididurans]MBM9508130.1 ABC transporter permease [Actinacidiphila acididurans]